MTRPNRPTPKVKGDDPDKFMYMPVKHSKKQPSQKQYESYDKLVDATIEKLRFETHERVEEEIRKITTGPGFAKRFGDSNAASFSAEVRNKLDEERK